jgi:hypothetical protein
MDLRLMLNAIRLTIAEDRIFRSHECTKYLGDLRVAEAW